MDDGPAWFAPKRFGYGAGLPISWQGWAVTIAFVVTALSAAFVFGARPLVLVSILAPLMLFYTLIAMRTTRGGWRWRWGGDD